MEGDKFKQVYSFFVLAITVLWAAFCVWITYRAVSELQATDVLASAGANVLLGALLNWCGNINQYWFRRAKPQ